jgi:glycosyltransferase involved in cell wall biosynthesis
MRVLAIEPYFGGSHRAFLEGWIARSRHEWTVLGLRPAKWKWRMRQAAVTCARQMADELAAGQRWDVLFCSDMLNLAEFRGLAPAGWRDLPALVYFHENQLAYPVQHEDERDYHFGLTNMTTALAADALWFNSAFNRDSFLDALPAMLKRMPDHRPFEAIEQIRAKAEIHPPGIAAFPPRGPRPAGPMRILWAARWEHDKDPETFFAALSELQARGVSFRVSVLGERFARCPAVFDEAQAALHAHIDRWGYQARWSDYQAALLEADVFVSTAQHEFFGISAVEALAAGAYVLLPNRLAYPEVLGPTDSGIGERFLYDGGAAELVERLADLAERVSRGELWDADPAFGVRLAERFCWDNLVPGLDDSLARLVG